MSTGARISHAILAARDKLAQGRTRVRLAHDGGALGVQVSLQLTEVLDEIVLDLYQWALSELWEQKGLSLVGQVALVAHGGYGRSDVAPFSDVDLMLLHSSKEETLTPLVRQFTNAIYDTGLQLGFSVRTVAQACELARGDATILTALAESRLLSGEETLFVKFQDRFRREAMRGHRTSIVAIETARQEERCKFGETVYLLEPNIKRSRGGLRDIQFVRWVGFTRYGESDLETLFKLGQLSQADWRRLRDAREFLLRLRNELHFHADRAQDVLERSEQVRIAKLWGYENRPGLLAVEQFMRDYFRHTENVRDAAEHFLETVRPASMVKSITEPLFSTRAENDYWVGPSFIRASTRGLERLKGDLAEILRLMVLSALYDKPIAHATWEAIRAEMDQRTEEDLAAPLSLEARKLFLDLITQPSQLGALLRRLHRLRVLEQIIPDMQHARCLLQFNSYHKYTVDEHSLRAVEAITDFQHDSGPVGDAYRAVPNKRVLHLAGLLHDLGKGYEEDHSELGRRIALTTAARLGLPKEEADTLAFLVHKHLRMSHLAQQHDIHDDRVVVPFAAEVGSPDVLRKLFVLTCADFKAVGPGALNAWRQQLITDLYFHTLQLLSSGSPEEAADRRVREKRAAVEALVRSKPDADWWQRIIAVLPAGILFSTEPQRIVDSLTKLHDLPHNDAVAWGRYVPERKAVEYAVGTYEEITPGIFHKLTGVLASRGQQILSAEIHTLADSLVLDHFYVEDRDYQGPPPPERIAEVSRDLVAALKNGSERPPEFRRTWQMEQRETTATLNRVPTQVRIDNDTSDRATILAIFTYDRMGLLYIIARTLSELGLSIARAKIGTRLDQVVDVFYVTDSHSGGKITDSSRLDKIRQRVLGELDQAAVESGAVPELPLHSAP